MPYVCFRLFGHGRQCDERVLYLGVVALCYLTSAAVAAVELRQLHLQHGGLHLVHAAVHSLQVVHVLLCAAIVGHGADGGSQLVVVGADGARIAQRAQVFAGVEAKARCVAQMPGSYAVLHDALRLCHVVHHLQTVSACHFVDALHVAAAAVEVHRQDGHCVLRDERLYVVGVDKARSEVWLAEHGPQSGVRDSQYGGYVGIRRHDDLALRRPAEHPAIGHEYERQCLQSVGHSHAVTCAHILGKHLLEALRLFAQQKPSTAHHTLDGF